MYNFIGVEVVTTTTESGINIVAMFQEYAPFVFLPDFLFVNHSSALEYSSRLRVSVYGTGTYRI